MSEGIFLQALGFHRVYGSLALEIDLMNALHGLRLLFHDPHDQMRLNLGDPYPGHRGLFLPPPLRVVGERAHITLADLRLPLIRLRALRCRLPALLRARHVDAPPHQVP